MSQPVCFNQGAQAPSAFIAAWAHLLAPGASVLDVACGSGRHTRFFAGRGHKVTALDRDPVALAGLADVPCERLEADIEGAPWPLPGRTFGAVVVTNYLHRLLMPTLIESVASSGVLLCETFAQGNETVGRPGNPDFLLKPGELLEMVRGSLRVIAFEDVFEARPFARYVQRIAAVREPSGTHAARYHADLIE
jgi:SAM-dependent methyltransferase